MSYGRFDDSRDAEGNRKYIRVTRPRAGTAVVTLNRPERLNSMAFEQMIPLHATFEELAHDNEVGVVVLTGTGKGFCSGADTQHSEPPPNIDGLTLTRIATRSMSILADLVPAMRRMPQPVIAAINGAAIGGGMCLSLGADVRIAGESAYFRAAGINNGLTAPELGLSFLLPRAIGSSRAFELMLSGRDMDAREAAEIGFVSRCVPRRCAARRGARVGRPDQRLEHERHPAHQADHVGGARGRQPGERGRTREPHAALRAAHDAELRGSGESAEGEARARFQGLTGR